jgi:hypothetical protein
LLELGGKKGLEEAQPEEVLSRFSECVSSQDETHVDVAKLVTAWRLMLIFLAMITIKSLSS